MSQCPLRYYTSVNDNNIESLVCFTCACVFPHVATQRRHLISWVRPLTRINDNDTDERGENVRFCNLTLDETRDFFGCSEYFERYGNQDGGPNLKTGSYANEFDDWTMKVPFGKLRCKILCCPEDRTCNACVANSNSLCQECFVPLCHHCSKALYKETVPRQPEGALSNDMSVIVTLQSL